LQKLTTSALRPKPMRLTPAERKRIAVTAAAKRWGKALEPAAALDASLVQLEPSDAIILAAARIFGEHGFEKPTMKEIADAAGVGIQTIYRCFPNKRALYTECCTNIFDLYSAYFVALLAGGSTPAERVYALVLGDCFVHLNPDLTRLIHRPILDQDREIIEAISAFAEVHEFMGKLKAQMQLLHPEDHEMKSYVLLGTVLGMSQLQPIARASRALADTLASVEVLAATCLRSVLPSIAWAAVRATVTFYPLDIANELQARRHRIQLASR
jgi:AcrR family transcriptional regulator